MTRPWKLAPGTRVQTAAHTDAWMSGDRYGTVTKVGRKLVHVAMQSGRTRKFALVFDGYAYGAPGLEYA